MNKYDLLPLGSLVVAFVYVGTLTYGEFVRLTNPPEQTVLTIHKTLVPGESYEREVDLRSLSDSIDVVKFDITVRSCARVPQSSRADTWRPSGNHLAVGGETFHHR